MEFVGQHGCVVLIQLGLIQDLQQLDMSIVTPTRLLIMLESHHYASAKAYRKILTALINHHLIQVFIKVSMTLNLPRLQRILKILQFISADSMFFFSIVIISFG